MLLSRWFAPSVLKTWCCVKASTLVGMGDISQSGAELLTAAVVPFGRIRFRPRVAVDSLARALRLDALEVAAADARCRRRTRNVPAVFGEGPLDVARSEFLEHTHARAAEG